jgi:hypothetical protein
MIGSVDIVLHDLVAGILATGLVTISILLGVANSLMTDAAKPMSPIMADIREIAYLSTSAGLGLLSAFASLMGGDKALTPRIVVAYLIAGALVSVAVTMFLIVEYGFSYFLLGVSIFAGYKAFDTLAMIGLAISKLITRLTDNKL